MNPYFHSVHELSDLERRQSSTSPIAADEFNSTEWDASHLTALRILVKKNHSEFFWPLSWRQKKKLVSSEHKAFIEGKGYSPFPVSEWHFVGESCKDDPMLGHVWFSLNATRGYHNWESASDPVLPDKNYASSILQYLLSKAPANGSKGRLRLSSADDFVVQYSPYRITHYSNGTGKCKIHAIDDGGLDLRVPGDDRRYVRSRVAVLIARRCFDSVDKDGKPVITDKGFGQLARVAMAQALDNYKLGSDAEKQSVIVIISALGCLRFLHFEVPKVIIHELIERGDLQNPSIKKSDTTMVSHTDWLDLRRKGHGKRVIRIVNQIVSQRLDEQKFCPSLRGLRKQRVFTNKVPGNNQHP
ncbi:hypothetical protein EV127DRAFT_496685 [Xylaria flabelliformis]|nr:hypothetical protein EV127DRAFT_496685 [Xylaria flabelliformis]